MLETSPTERRKLSLEAQILQIALILLISAGFFLVSPNELAAKWCPTNSFYIRVLHLDYWPFMFGVSLAPCIYLLFLLLASLVDLSLWSGATALPRSSRRNFTLVVCVLACGSALSACLYVRGVSDYYCLTPDEIVVRTGYFDKPNNYHWDAVKTVHGWCWTNKPKRGAAILGGSVNLVLDSGTELSVNLLGDHETVSPYYQMVKKRTAGEDLRLLRQCNGHARRMPAGPLSPTVELAKR